MAMLVKKPYPLIMFLAALTLSACKNGTQKVEPRQVESDSATPVVSDHPITDMLYAELDSADVYDDAVIQGYWFKPHEACYVNVFFHEDNTFEYKFYTVDRMMKQLTKSRKAHIPSTAKRYTWLLMTAGTRRCSMASCTIRTMGQTTI